MRDRSRDARNVHLPNAFDKYAIYALFPGIVGSMAVSNNAHAFHLWIAALLNFFFYFLLCWSTGSLILKLFRILKRS